MSEVEEITDLSGLTPFQRRLRRVLEIRGRDACFLVQHMSDPLTFNRTYFERVLAGELKIDEEILPRVAQLLRVPLDVLEANLPRHTYLEGVEPPTEEDAVDLESALQLELRTITSLGGRVKFLRERRGVSIQALATLAGVSSATISQLERGVRVPQEYILERVAAGLKVAIPDLVEGFNLVYAQHGKPGSCTPVSPDTLDTPSATRSEADSVQPEEQLAAEPGLFQPDGDLTPEAMRQIEQARAGGTPVQEGDMSWDAQRIKQIREEAHGLPVPAAQPDWPDGVVGNAPQKRCGGSVALPTALDLEYVSAAPDVDALGDPRDALLQDLDNTLAYIRSMVASGAPITMIDLDINITMAHGQRMALGFKRDTIN
jgi:DNA-binding XRE family transcriptional regulator